MRSRCGGRWTRIGGRGTSRVGGRWSWCCGGSPIPIACCISNSIPSFVAVLVQVSEAMAVLQRRERLDEVLEATRAATAVTVRARMALHLLALDAVDAAAELAREVLDRSLDDREVGASFAHTVLSRVELAAGDHRAATARLALVTGTALVPAAILAGERGDLDELVRGLAAFHPQISRWVPLRIRLEVPLLVRATELLPPGRTRAQVRALADGLDEQLRREGRIRFVPPLDGYQP